MAKQRREEYIKKEKKEVEWVSDQADGAFWDEFWSLESRGQGDTYTIIVRNERTGEEEKIENVRLQAQRKKLVAGN